MRLINRGAFVMAAGVVLGAASPALAFKASFRWCSGTPVVSLSAVPKGTTEIRFEMTDLNKPSFNHGGGRVAYSGQKSIACGGFSGSFIGPSPPPPEVHTYEIEFEARGVDGSVLSKARARQKFPQ